MPSMVCSLSISMTRPSVASSPPSASSGKVFGDPEFLADLVDVLELVRRVFVRPEDAEAVHVQLHHVAKEGAQRPGVFGFDLRRAYRASRRSLGSPAGEEPS